MDPATEEYIKKSLKEGENPAIIRQNLESRGLSKEDIAAALPLLNDSPEQHSAIVPFILSSTFFIPFLPLFGMILGISFLSKNKDIQGTQKALAILSVGIGAFITLIHILSLIIYVTALFALNADPLSEMETLAEEGDYQGLIALSRSLVLEGVIDEDTAFSYSLNLMEALSDKGDHEGMITLATAYLEDGTDEQKAVYHYLRAIVYMDLDRLEDAISDLESVLSFSQGLSNVEQREFSEIHFELGHIYYHLGDLDNAQRYYESGLVLEPQFDFYNIQLGQVLLDKGETERAIEHYQILSEKSSLSAEDKTIIAMKLDRLLERDPVLTHPELEQYNPAFTVRILPINNASVEIDPLCDIIKSKYRVSCAGLDHIHLPESSILNTMRNQYDADQIIDDLYELYGSQWDTQGLIIAITDKDIYSGDTSFVFGLNHNQWRIGVISTHMFNITISLIEERDLILTRRIAIQSLSSIGQQLGIPRPTMSHCPLSYTHSIGDFTMKTPALCPETKQTNDEFTARYPLIEFSPAEKEQILQTYQKYYIS